jgi:hypothetical protein
VMVRGEVRVVTMEVVHVCEGSWLSPSQCTLAK